MVARAALSALHHEGGVQKGSATETWWSTWSWIAMTSGVNGPCGSLMRGEKTHRRSEGLERPLGKPCCGMGQNGKTSRACRDLLACTAFNQPRGALACGGGAGDTFSRAGSGGGGVDVIKGTRRWTLVSRRPSQVSTSRHPLVNETVASEKGICWLLTSLISGIGLRQLRRMAGSRQSQAVKVLVSIWTQ